MPGVPGKHLKRLLSHEHLGRVPSFMQMRPFDQAQAGLGRKAGALVVECSAHFSFTNPRSGGSPGCSVEVSMLSIDTIGLTPEALLPCAGCNASNI